ncbi:MAG: hypothetical protein Q8Q09_10325 [Deltaproteobacteria bacterium]|nr:hypothetical protein [Deltaproteobacteria bacterium]
MSQQRIESVPPCPRDGQPMRKADALFGCDHCHGVLAPGQSVEALHPALSRIEASRNEALASAAHGTGVGVCVLCRQRSKALSFFEVAIDWCSHCGAVWLDGNEIDQLREQIERYRDQTTDRAMDPYRTAANVTARMVVLGQVTCVFCQRTVGVKDSVYSSSGLLCIACSSEQNGELPSPESAAEVDAWLEHEAKRRVRQRDWGHKTEDARRRERAAMSADPIGEWIRWWKSLLGIQP